ncbi:LysR family transcriptional regulator [Lactiplantibacillus plantarum]|uniref:LysR family transcriptional regulator n=1 Tax=Lactiplantibacillus plantarum TaxID=1590 RepID=UPI0015ECCFF8|nr:LysR family transcriptional regulator [Lactiplantibacillus plantarum]MBA3078127.1 LysR family transcriptional regulator [Lactiplantibacillus plantarum]MBA3080964.1 LysR family transcriptional regulator [Lactiplantibacillus plantarum]MBA3083926.1 LysR family transcriptional regulator [Lactiplantibacillus plantarum]MCG0773376.1 transcription regulator [Lactiplantibacillus plantarum]MDT4759062.1 LysR family transcriptional regulator [Lactiplantibacillus plantarum]
MDLQYLDNFLALAHYRSFSAAADACYISQSSFSKRIMRLENNLGVTLFERSTRQVSLTEYCQIYLKYAQQIKTLSRQATDEINRRHAEDEGIVIGGIPSISEYGILDLISGFIKTTHIHCQVKSAPSEDLEPMLLNQTLDFAFIKEVHHTNLFYQLPYAEDHLVAVLPANHPLANLSEIKLQQLANEDFIFQPVNSRPYELCMMICKQNGFTPNVIYADRIIENILNFVKKGLGVSLLMEKLVPKDSELICLPIHPAVVADINLCYLKKEPLSQYGYAFLNYFSHQNNAR